MRNVWKWFSTPSTRYSLGVLIVVGALFGAAGLAAFNTTIEATSTDEFCVSCHELEVNIGIEYEGMSHAKNAKGFRASCAGCHVPAPFVPKMFRKMRAVAEIYHHILGTIDTPEKFEAHRMRMATRVWADMNENDSRECRTCHSSERWDEDVQSEKAREYHSGPLSRGKTCIDCHKGVAHRLPAGITEDAQLPGIDH